MSDELSPEEKEILDRALGAVLEKLTSAGWLESARDANNFAINWTELGKDAAMKLGILFRTIRAQEMNAIELSQLVEVIESMSPGGSDPSANALD